jgi:hypothetical protein
MAIRVVRPHETEEAWFERELETMTRSSLLLVGVSARPAGTILRFEVTLKGGKAVLRGEGKVVEVRSFEGTEGRAKAQSMTNEFEPLSEVQPVLSPNPAIAKSDPKPEPESTPEPEPAPQAAAPPAPPRHSSQPPIALPEPFPESPRQIVAAKRASEAPGRASEAPTREIPIVNVGTASDAFEALRRHAHTLTRERMQAILEEGARIHATPQR